jgi:tetratricopeptide (TPR) repeat protein
MRITPALGFAAIGLMFVSSVPSARAETKQEYDWCYGATATNDQTIQGCAAMIQSGQYTGSKLASAYANRGFGYIGNHQYDLAIQDLNEAIRLNPRDPQSFDNRGHAYYEKGQYELAIQDCNEAIRLNPRQPMFHHNRGMTYVELEKWDDAIKDYDQAIALNPKYAQAYHDRSLARRKRGDVKGADADLAKARQLRPNSGW